MKYDYSVCHNEWCGWQLWRGPKGGFRHTQLVRHLLPQSVRMMQLRGMLRLVGLSSALQVTMPNARMNTSMKTNDARHRAAADKANRKTVQKQRKKRAKTNGGP